MAELGFQPPISDESVDAAYVDDQLGELSADEDLSRFIL